VILGVEGDGVYLSNDNAKTFTRTCDGLRNLTITSIAADPVVPKNVYAAVAFGGASSGIYHSKDAGVTWAKLAPNDLPPVLSLVVTENPETTFVAGTEKGFFWSSDGATWTQAPPSASPIRVDKVLRFNKIRYFAATSEGVFTSRDAGKSWYRLGDADNRTVDMAVGNLGDKRALFALTSVGVRAFDGTQWMPVEGAPAKGRTLAVRGSGNSQILFVAGAHGVKAGQVDANGKWHDAAAPDAQFATVFAGSRSSDNVVFVAARQQHELLIAEPKQSDWRAFALPSSTTEVTAIALDPFAPDRLYLGTLGEGIFIFEGKPQHYEAKKKPDTEAAALATN
jgi:hypothetical protein